MLLVAVVALALVPPDQLPEQTVPKAAAPTTAPAAETSARCVVAAESPDERVAPGPAISPGLPPLFSFRYYEGKLRGRFANMDLMLDDAGH